jgi:hypothetical protein
MTQETQVNPTKWYYAVGNTKKGPIAEEEVIALIGQEIMHDTFVWKAGMENWMEAAKTDLAPFFESVPPPLNQPAAERIASSPPPTDFFTCPATETIEDNIQWMDKMWLWMAILYGVRFLLIFTVVGRFIGIPALIAGVVLQMMLLYKFWSAIQDGNARTTPGKAVGFMFIPFFNFYWVFVGILGLTQDINRYISERRLTIKRVDENMALIICILSIGAIIPFLGILARIGAGVLIIITWKDLIRVTGDILKSKPEFP